MPIFAPSSQPKTTTRKWRRGDEQVRRVLPRQLEPALKVDRVGRTLREQRTPAKVIADAMKDMKPRIKAVVEKKVDALPKD